MVKESHMWSGYIWLMVVCSTGFGAMAPAGDPAYVRVGGVDDGVAYRVDVAPGLAFVSGNDGVIIDDTAVPESPRRVGSDNVEGGVFAMAVRDGTLWAAAPDSGLISTDIRDPASPTRLDELDAHFACSPHDIASRGVTIYVADQDDGLIVLERRESDRRAVSAPSSPFDAVGSGPLECADRPHTTGTLSPSVLAHREGVDANPRSDCHCDHAAAPDARGRDGRHGAGPVHRRRR
jgi:hypothetical protein